MRNNFFSFIFLFLFSLKIFSQGVPQVPMTKGGVGGVTKDEKNPPRTIVNEILDDYNSAKTFADYIKKAKAHMISGDDVYLSNLLKRNPDLLKLKRIPEIIYENMSFSVRYGKNVITIKFTDKEKFEFEVNRQRIVLNPAMVPSVRWQRINDVLIQAKTSWISFMPVAFAQEHGEPTYTSVMIFTITSRMARNVTTSYNIKMEDKRVAWMQVWKKAKENNGLCRASDFRNLGKWLAEIQVNSIRCEEKTIVIKKIKKQKKEIQKITGDIVYEIPYGENSYRTLTLRKNRKSVEESTPEKKDQIIVYTKSSKKNIWMPRGKVEPEFIERAYQISPLVFHSFQENFCNKCGGFIKSAVKEIASEIEVDPTLQVTKDTENPNETTDENNQNQAPQN